MLYFTLTIDKCEVEKRSYTQIGINVVWLSTFKKMEWMLAHVTYHNEMMDTKHKNELKLLNIDGSSKKLFTPNYISNDCDYLNQHHIIFI